MVQRKYANSMEWDKRIEKRSVKIQRHILNEPIIRECHIYTIDKIEPCKSVAGYLQILCHKVYKMKQDGRHKPHAACSQWIFHRPQKHIVYMFVFFFSL